MKPAELKLLLDSVCKMTEDRLVGLGIMVYRGRYDQLPVAPLTLPLGAVHRQSKLEVLKLLVECAEGTSIYHDGFQLIKEGEYLTHVSQYIAPGIPDGLQVLPGFGCRYRTAQYASLLENVVACGVVSRNYGPTVFVNGEAYVDWVKEQ